MWLTPLTVECHAGARAEERPRRFRWESRRVELREVLDGWCQVESLPEWPRADYFKVRGAAEWDYLLKHDPEADEWFVCGPPPEPVSPARRAQRRAG